MFRNVLTATALSSVILFSAGCSANDENQDAKDTPKEHQSHNSGKTASNDSTKQNNSSSDDQHKAVTASAHPSSIEVLVNKSNLLPDNYEPADLVYPNVPFIFKEKIEKRMMRKEAAQALEKLFQAAKADGMELAGVSAYRSHTRQVAVFNSYVKKDGLEKAKTYSAIPGTSEHETGLAIDVGTLDGKCAAQDCFGQTPESSWLAKHAGDYGFIIRYPQGKQNITGYKYEAWHIRYVGVKISKEIAARGITLEEYYNSVPVSK